MTLLGRRSLFPRLTVAVIHSCVPRGAWGHMHVNSGALQSATLGLMFISKTGAQRGGRLGALKAVNHILPLIVLCVFGLTGNAPNK
jgi:hypothetical protein